MQFLFLCLTLNVLAYGHQPPFQATESNCKNTALRDPIDRIIQEPLKPVDCYHDYQNASEKVIRRAYTAISRIEGGRIFLKPDKLCLKQGVIYVEDIDGGEFAIPVMFSAVGYPQMEVDDSIVFNAWKCECGAWNHKWDNPTHCWHCGAPR
ncbi:MAG: hypothetical protein KGR16_00010 [Verrucomicrobia bacterium]|nr:hypothetical protein [Verrucomicrobiota bacterium]MDE3048092.1 hypothetical protein [Verrucomicrobiota bacterium]